MKIFLSWSGGQSREVAELFSDWIQCVIQECKPWISTRDIERGSVWFSEISDQLKDVSIGVIFLTKENLNKPWILFEAGALAKGLTNSRVCTFLVDLAPADIAEPLSQFNHTLVERSYVFGLVKTLNAYADSSLSEKVIDRIFDTYWSQFILEFEKISEKYTKDAELSVDEREEVDYLSEILSSVKNLSNRISRMEAKERDLHPAWLKNLENRSRHRAATEYWSLSDLEGYRRQIIKQLIDDGININKIAEMLKEEGFSDNQIHLLLDPYNRENE
jgi:TIR domain